MICKHQLSLCKIHNCVACEHQGNEEHCRFAYNESTDENAPTFKQAFDIYRDADFTRKHRNEVIKYIAKDIERVGLTEESKCSDMTRTKFKTLICLLSAPLSDGHVLSGETILSHLNAFRSISSEWLEEKYSDAGLDLPSFSIPRYKFVRRKVQEVSDRTIRKVEIEMEKWLVSGRRGDRDAYIFCFFALYCGMRAGDICSAKWDIIKHTTAGVMIAYVPHKTLHSSCASVSFVIDNRTYCKIEPLIGKSDEYVISRYANRTPPGRTKDGAYVGMHVYLRRKVNKMLSMCGIGNEYKGQKKAHALRKYYETDRVFSVGREQAAKECGHTVEVQRRNYLGTMVGKVM